METAAEQPDVFVRLGGLLVRLLGRKGVTPDMITPEASLTEDLGMDSFEFVDLTVAIESEFALNRFPMQQWIDEERIRRSGRFDVGSLARRIQAERLA